MYYELVKLLAICLGFAIITGTIHIWLYIRRHKEIQSMQIMEQNKSNEAEEQRERTVSKYLEIDIKHLIISHKNFPYFKVQTNGKSYIVKFNNDYTEIEKIVEEYTSMKG